MIRVFSFRPEYFNNNGDQGNLEALAHFTDQEISTVAIDDAEFALFGDGSRAAIREFGDELDSLVPALEKRLQAGLPTLIVGSAYEFFAPKLSGLPILSYGDRVSEFREVRSNDIAVKGYRNSEVIDSDLFLSGHFVATTLFGPVLAKNISLLQHMAQGLGLQVSVSDHQRSWIEKL